jgi:hypothetical protein
MLALTRPSRCSGVMRWRWLSWAMLNTMPAAPARAEKTGNAASRQPGPVSRAGRHRTIVASAEP